MHASISQCTGSPVQLQTSFCPYSLHSRGSPCRYPCVHACGKAFIHWIDDRLCSCSFSYLGLYSFSCHDSTASMQKGWIADTDAERSSSQLLAFDTCHSMQSLQISKGTSCGYDAMKRNPPTSLTMMRIFKFSTGSSNRQYLVGIAVATQRDNECSLLLAVTVNSGYSPSGII